MMAMINERRMSRLASSLADLKEEEFESIFAIFSKALPAFMAEFHSLKES
ncbi:MAG: hypothetical protein QMD53_03555 [Actinomycetota bacterium]|nr:hypothetical protein [Actinomycetota bacterium]